MKFIIINYLFLFEIPLLKTTELSNTHFKINLLGQLNKNFKIHLNSFI